jgi:hypothetical protein
MRISFGLAAVLAFAAVPAFSLPAFPGAEGYGSETVGGRGGQVIEVTNLNAGGTGSFRAALETAGPRIIVFRVGGIIDLPYDTEIGITEPYLTVAGQTAPGDGICIRGGAIGVRTNDVIIRGLRVRPGDDYSHSDPDFDGPDGLKCSGSTSDHDRVRNVIFDHCSISWAIDENFSLWYPLHDITVQYCIISEALACTGLHTEGGVVQCHSMGFLTGPDVTNVSIHHNLLAHNENRNALIRDNNTIEWINNVIYDWNAQSTQIGSYDMAGADHGPTYIDFIGNYYKQGPSAKNCLDNGRPERHGITLDIAGVYAGSLFYMEDNIGPHREDGTGDEWLVAGGPQGYCDTPPDPSLKSETPVVSRRVSTIHTAFEAFDVVLDNVGASFNRDAVDTRVVQEVRDGTGMIPDSVADVGGYPSYSGAAAPEDSDHDGMPDEWESERELDPNSASDAADDRDGDGYTNVEEYINCIITPEYCVPTAAAAPRVMLRQSAVGREAAVVFDTRGRALARTRIGTGPLPAGVYVVRPVDGSSCAWKMVISGR